MGVSLVYGNPHLWWFPFLVVSLEHDKWGTNPISGGFSFGFAENPPGKEGTLLKHAQARNGLDPLANLGLKRSKKFFARRPNVRRGVFFVACCQGMLGL